MNSEAHRNEEIQREIESTARRLYEVAGRHHGTLSVVRVLDPRGGDPVYRAALGIDPECSLVASFGSTERTALAGLLLAVRILDDTMQQAPG